MKKILSLLLILVIGVTLFTGCSNKESVENTEIRTEVEIEDVVTDPEQNTANIEKEKKDALEDAIKGKEPETDTDSERGKYSHVKGDIKEQKIYDDNAIVITAKGFDFTGTDPKFLLEIENNGEHDFEFTVENVAINNFMMDAKMKKTVQPKQKETTSIVFQNLTFFDQRIKTIEDLAFTINMTDSELKLTTGEIVLKTGLKAEEYPEILKGQTVIDKNGVKITYLDMEYPNKYHYGPVLYFCIENTLSDEIGIVTDDREATVNGRKVDAHFGYNILPNRRIITEFEIDNKDLTLAEISTIETMMVDDWKCLNQETNEVVFKEEKFTLENLQDTVIELNRGKIE